MSMNLRVQLLLLFIALARLAAGQQSGGVPPPLVWDKLKGDCPASLDWTSLRGSVVVVSFGIDDVFLGDVTDWAEIQQQFQEKPVAFLQIVTGWEFLLDRALSKVTYAGCILLDSHDTNRQNFNLPMVRRTVVVDQFGIIAGYSIAGPDERAVRSVLDRKTVTGLSETPLQPQHFDPAAGLDPAPSYEVHISSAQRGELRTLGQGSLDTYISRNQPLKLIVIDLWDTPLARIVFPETLDKGNYDVIAHIPVADRDLLLKLVQEAVERRFALLVEKEERPERVYVLKATGDLSPQIQPAKATESWMSGGGLEEMIGTAQTMEDIASALQGRLRIPVVDGTGWNGKYDYSVSSKLSGPEAALDLAHQLGLELTEEERPTEMLVVRTIE